MQVSYFPDVCAHYYMTVYIVSVIYCLVILFKDTDVYCATTLPFDDQS